MGGGACRRDGYLESAPGKALGREKDSGEGTIGNITQFHPSAAGVAGADHRSKEPTMSATNILLVDRLVVRILLLISDPLNFPIVYSNGMLASPYSTASSRRRQETAEQRDAECGAASFGEGCLAETKAWSKVLGSRTCEL